MSKIDMDMKKAIESAEYMPQVQIVQEGEWPVKYERTWMMRDLRRVAKEHGVSTTVMLRAILTLWLHARD